MIALELTRKVKVGLTLFWVLFPIMGGIVGLYVFWLYWVRPVAALDDGLQMRFGRKFRYADYVKCRAVPLVGQSDRDVGLRLEIVFKNGTARIDSWSFANFKPVVAFIEQRLQRKLFYPR